MLVTPLQLANAYATFANGGTVWRPDVAREIVEAERRRRCATWRHRPVRPSTSPPSAQPILDGLGVVTDPGHRATPPSRLPARRFPLAGKTGTAQVANKQDTALFAAFAPADNPQYAVSVVMEEAGFGGTRPRPSPAASSMAHRRADRARRRAGGATD